MKQTKSQPLKKSTKMNMFAKPSCGEPRSRNQTQMHNRVLQMLKRPPHRHAPSSSTRTGHNQQADTRQGFARLVSDLTFHVSQPRTPDEKRPQSACVEKPRVTWKHQRRALPSTSKNARPLYGTFALPDLSATAPR